MYLENSIEPDNKTERSKAQQMVRRDPHREEDLGERFSQFASVCGITDGHDLRSANDTPALNALKALRGAPISMGRGETPVRLQLTTARFCLLTNIVYPYRKRRFF